MENMAEERLSSLTREIDILSRGIECFDEDDKIREDIKEALERRKKERDQLIKRLAFRQNIGDLL